jgi:outer membrane receptor for ferric coprogen and ferric-rhodotorulic acid
LPRETPQTITVITRQKIDDFGLTDVDKVLESTSGVFVEKVGNNGANHYSHGFQMQSQYDGQTNPVGIGGFGVGNTPHDSAFLDHVEIQQGAAGLLSGAGEPGGTINLVRKRATYDFQAHVEAQAGSWDKKRLVGDISGPLVSSGRIRGRVVVKFRLFINLFNKQIRVLCIP